MCIRDSFQNRIDIVGRQVTACADRLAKPCAMLERESDVGDGSAVCHERNGTSIYERSDWRRFFHFADSVVRNLAKLASSSYAGSTERSRTFD